MDQGHPIDVTLEKILPILAKEIYNTPFAFLRENVQNAIDAIRVQRYREETAGISSEHKVRIVIAGRSVAITDTGIGMTRVDLRTFFWSIGQSGKHTEEAKRAGVVGTFGIGGMANFGVCSRLEVRTLADGGEPIVSWALRNELSVSKDCVFYQPGPPDMEGGTTLSAELIEPIDPTAAANYLRPIVQYLDVPVYVNDNLLSLENFPAVDRTAAELVEVAIGELRLAASVTVSAQAQPEATVLSMTWRAIALGARGWVRAGHGTLAAYQYGFKLAQVPAVSPFSLGGALDCPVFRPTAGREALVAESQSLAQTCLAAFDAAIAKVIGSRPDLVDRFSGLFTYIRNHGAWELAGLATVRLYGSSVRVPMRELQDRSKYAKVYFAGDRHDRSIMETYRQQGRAIVLLSNDGNRQQVEREYLTRHCQAEALEDRISCLRVFADEELTFREVQFLLTLSRKLHTQFFIDDIFVRAGDLTHEAAMFAPPRSSGAGMVLFVDVRRPQLRRLIDAPYSLGYEALFDMFVRDSVFPHLQSVFPELRSRDFDMLLKKLQSTFEYFQIDPEDIERLRLLAEVTQMEPEAIARTMGAGRVGLTSAAVVSAAEVVTIQEIIQSAPVSPGEIGTEPAEPRQSALLAKLLATEIKGKILDAREAPPESGVSGYYMALTPEAHILYRRLLDRRPAADFMWGGNRAGYIFYTGGTRLLYYDIELMELIEPTPSLPRAGSVQLERDVVLVRNMAFLPIPIGFERYFVPSVKTLRFTIKHQICPLDDSLTGTSS